MWTSVLKDHIGLSAIGGMFVAYSLLIRLSKQQYENYNNLFKDPSVWGIIFTA